MKNKLCISSRIRRPHEKLKIKIVIRGKACCKEYSKGGKSVSQSKMVLDVREQLGIILDSTRGGC